MALGPGLLESVYTVILQKKLEQRGYRVQREVPIPVGFEGLQFELGFRADLVVNDCFIIELKSVEKLAPVHSMGSKESQTRFSHEGRCCETASHEGER
jgi:iron complex transport system substrate-binding protein